MLEFNEVYIEAFEFDGLEDMQVWCAKMLEAATLTSYGVKGGTA